MLALQLLSLTFTLSQSQSTGSFEVWSIPLPFEMDEFGVGIYDDNLIIYNGNAKETNGKHINNTSGYSLLLSPLSSTWSHHTNIKMPYHTNHIRYDTQTTVQVQNYVYGINSIMSSDSNSEHLPEYNSVLIYNLATNSYLNPINDPNKPPLGWPCVVANSQHIYSIGGEKAPESEVYHITKEMWIYNLHSEEWHEGSHINIPRYKSGCSFDSNSQSIYLFGGLVEYNDNNHHVYTTNSIDKYVVENEHWHMLPEQYHMPHAVYGLFCILYPMDSNIYCIGGANEHEEVVNYAQIFNPIHYSFNIKYLKKNRMNVNVAVYNNKCMMVLGGYENHNYMNSIEIMNCDFVPPPVSNNTFICPPNKDCFIDCKYINNTNNYDKNVNFSCNTKQSIINATLAKSLTVICYDEHGIGGCNNLTTFCAPNAECNINCNGNNGCNLLSVNTKKSSVFSLNCNANKTCENVTINNDNSNILNSVQLHCSNNGCSNINIDEMGIGELYIYCIDENNINVCNRLILNAPNSNKIEIIIIDNNMIQSSIMNFTTAKNVHITTAGGTFINNSINCVDCNAFIFNCSDNGKCIDSVLNASHSSDFQMFCSSDSTDYGCNNMTLYLPPAVSKNSQSQITCDYLGCNWLNIYNIHSTVTNDASFTLQNCPCQQDIYTNCINKFNLFCNGRMNNPSIFSNGFCTGECCGNITNQFHIINCSPFDCHNTPKQCNINCTSLATHSYDCDHQIINAKNVTSLNVYCDDNINCNELEIECPYFDTKKNTKPNAQCNIYCNGTENCDKMKINTNGINSFNFQCNGICNDIVIDNSYELNNNVAENVMSINCNNANCNNINVKNVRQSYVNIICDTNCTYNQLNINGPDALSLSIQGENGTISNSIMNVQNVSQLVIHINNGTLQNNVINAMNATNVTLNNSVGKIVNNTLNVNKAIDVNIQNQNVFSENIINAQNSKNIHFSVNPKSTLNSSLNVQINASNAGNIYVYIGEHSVISNDFILDAKNASLLTLTIDGYLMNNKINSYNTTKYIINSQNAIGQINNSVINCETCNSLQINNVFLSNNTININNGKSLNINSIYGGSFSNINGKNLNSFYILSDSLSGIYDLSNTKNITVFIAHTMKRTSNNNNNYGIIMANHSQNINISVADGATLNNFTLYATYAKSISAMTNGLLQNAMFNGKNASYLSIKCNATNKKLGCQNVSIVTSLVNNNNNKPSSYLECTDYGCSSLNIFTRESSNDLNVTGQDCDCKEDLTNLCINEWNIYCQNDPNPSVFKGFHCTGKCCAGIDKRLEEKICIKPKKSSNKTDWTLIIILICIVVFAIIPFVVIVCKRKQACCFKKD